METLKWIGWISLVSVAICAVAMVAAPSLGAELLLGMAAPWLAAVLTLEEMERMSARGPQRLRIFLLWAFCFKMAFYGLYVSLVLGVFSFQVVPFVASFTLYFIGTHLVEALYLRTLSAQPELGGGP